MNRLAWLALALLATTLVTALAMELDAGRTAEDVTGIVPLHHAPLALARAPTEDPADHSDEWVGQILARPLFSRDRRPTVVAARTGGGVAEAGLPRLTGVMVGPFGRSAIFAGDSGGKAVVVAEGGSLGRYTVQLIEPGRVTVAGPEGVRLLMPSFDAEARRAVAEAPPPPPRVPPQILNGRFTNQFQRALSAAQATRPTQDGTE